MFIQLVSWFENRPKISWAITLIGAISIFLISSITFPQGDSSGLNLKPLIYHFFAFFFFAAFMLMSIVQRKHKNLLGLAVLLSILYGVLDEVHQLYVVGRDFSVGDILVDVLGVSVASIIYIATIKLRKSK
jgi:VanZ family protein